MSKARAFLAAVLLLLPCAAWAQAPQFAPGQIFGNSTAATRPGRTETVTAILDRALGSTRGALLERGASGWAIVGPSATTGLAWISQGAGADPVYGVVGLAGGGCNAVLTASNGGILYSTASACAVLAGTATARLPLLSGASTTPQWGAFTLPASVTSGGVACYTSTTVQGSSSLLTLNAILVGGGAGACPSVLGSLGTTTTVLHGNASGSPSFGPVVAADMALFNYIAGLTIANDGVTPNTVMDVAVGVATSDDNTTGMALTTVSFSKNMNSAWVVGSTNGCADGAASYTTLGATTWYHLFLIERTDTQVVDVLCSKSATAPTLPTNYTKKRRIGAVATDGSSHIRLFTQSGTEFLWSAITSNVSTNNPGTSAILATMDVPTGVQVRVIAEFLVRNDSTTVRNCALITSPDQADTAPTPGSASTICAGSASSALQFFIQNHAEVRTNTSGQIRYRMDSSSTNTAFFAMTQGWIDNL